MCIEFLDKYDGVLPNTPRSYGRVCCICGRDETYLYNDTPVWIKYKDENGRWTGEWVCNNCRRRRKGYKFKNKKLKKCRLCGSDKTRIRSDGKALWEKDINHKGKWTGDYICYKCAYENKPSCGHTNRFYKIYDKNEIWTGERRCSACERDQ